MFWKLGETIKTSSFHLSNFEKILGSRTRCTHGTRCPRSRFSLSRLALPTHPSRASYKVRFLITWHHSKLFKVLYLLRKLGRLCLSSHKDRGLGLTPWFHLFYFTNDFAETIPSNIYQINVGWDPRGNDTLAVVKMTPSAFYCVEIFVFLIYLFWLLETFLEQIFVSWKPCG